MSVHSGDCNAAIGHIRQMWETKMVPQRTDYSVRKGLKIGEAALYFGQLNARQQPHGRGVLLLANGSEHVGQFVDGRASGCGFYLTPQGDVFHGSWQQNMRVGAFFLVDAKGKLWNEQYNDAGKRCQRRLACSDACGAGHFFQTECLGVEPNTQISDIDGRKGTSFLNPAKTCAICGHLFQKMFNNACACRRHSGEWKPHKNTSLPSSGTWTCCGAKKYDIPGCELCKHRC